MWNLSWATFCELHMKTETGNIWQGISKMIWGQRISGLRCLGWFQHCLLRSFPRRHLRKCYYDNLSIHFNSDCYDLKFRNEKTVDFIYKWKNKHFKIKSKIQMWFLIEAITTKVRYFLLKTALEKTNNNYNTNNSSWPDWLSRSCVQAFGNF